MNIQRLWSVTQGYTDGLSMAEVLRIPPSIPRPLYYVGRLFKSRTYKRRDTWRDSGCWRFSPKLLIPGDKKTNKQKKRVASVPTLASQPFLGCSLQSPFQLDHSESLDKVSTTCGFGNSKGMWKWQMHHKSLNSRQVYNNILIMQNQMNVSNFFFFLL